MATASIVQRPAKPTAPEPPAGTKRPPAEDLAWVGVIVAAIALAAVAVWLAPLAAHLYPKPNRDVFPGWSVEIMPEPREEARAILALGTPILLALVVATLSTSRPRRRSLDPLIVGAQVTGAGLLVLAILEQPRRSGFLPLDYFDKLLLSRTNLVLGLLIGLALTAIVLRWRRELPEHIVEIGRWFQARSWIALAIAILATAIWLLPAIQSDATVGESGVIAAGHIPLQGQDYFSVVNGRTPLVNYIADYANLLPYIVAPVLDVFHTSITSFTSAMNVLSGLALLAIFGVFAQVTRGRWTALALYVPFLALALFPWNDVGSHREFAGIYLGVLPGRYFGPFLLAFLCALSTRRRVPIWVLYGCGGLVVLNNAEFGVGSVLAMTAALLVSLDRSSPLWPRLRQLVVQGAAGLLAAVALVSTFTLIRAGALPDPTLLTYYSRVFWYDSFGLVPMHTLGLHWALYATYAGALITAAVRFVRAEPDRTLTAMLAFSGVFGLATGMYFVGRSSQFQLMLLFPAWGFALALLAWTAAHALRSAAGDRDRLVRLLVPGCAALIGFGVMVSAIDRFPRPGVRSSDSRMGGPRSTTRRRSSASSKPRPSRARRS